MSTWHLTVIAAFAAFVFTNPARGFAASGEQTPSVPLRLQLVAGQHIKVEGHTQDGVFQARQVTLRDSDTSAKVEGAIASVSSDRRRLDVLGFDVVLDATTRLYRGSQPSRSRSMLVRGTWIEVKGSWHRGLLKATRVRVKEAPEATEEIEGFIEAADPQSSSVVVLSRRVILPDALAIVDERTGRPAEKNADRLRRDDDDGQGGRPIVVGNVLLGGRGEAGFLEEENFDAAERETERKVLSRVQILASSQLTETIEVYAKTTMSRNVTVGGPAQADLRLSEAYVLVHRIGGAPVDLQIGRQRFRDSREWFFDDYLDAARVHVTLPAVKLEAAVSRGIFRGPEALRDRRDQLQFIASAATRLPAGVQLGGYVIARRDTTRGERPMWIGGTLSGRAGLAWTYWGDAAVRRGKAVTTRLGGWALDAGASHKWARSWTPTLTVGYAIGSGDRTRGDGRDTRFRQTNLEDNQAYFGGLRRLAIYGEVFDPELSNLQVLTAGVGVRPRRGLSVDAIYHHFRQATPTTSLPSSNLDGALSGNSRALGHEVNVVLTLRAIPGVDLDLASGVFVPGRAFVGNPAPAFFWRPQIRFYF